MNDTPPSPHPQISTTVHKWTLAVLSGLGVILVLIIGATVAVAEVQTPQPRPIKKVVRVSADGPVPAVEYISVSPGMKPAPDGQLHDAYSQTTFHVHVGTPLKLVVDNTDTVPHGIVSTQAGVNLVIKPGTHTYTILVKKRGVFSWACNQPCDPYSMTHTGYMMGQIIAT